MRALKRIAIALALAAPGTAFAATDGTLGTTSTGTFQATLTVTPPTSDTVQIIGLQDFDFGTVAADNTAQINIEDYLCLNRSAAGNVSVTISQIDHNASNFLLKNTQTGDSYFVLVSLRSVDATTVFEMSNNVPAIMPSSDAAICTASSGLFTAQYMRLAVVGPYPFNNGPTTLSAQFNMTLAPQ